MKKILILSLMLLPTLLRASNPSDSISFKPSKDSVIIIHPEFPATPFLDEAPDVLSEGFVSPTSANDSIQRYLDLARTVFGKLRETKNIITNIDQASRFELPVSLPKLVGGIDYELAIYAIRLKPAYAELDVLLRFVVPQNNQELIFKANSIKFTSKGGIIGDTKLELVGDYAINLNGNKSQIILKGSASKGNTFVTIDCDGFKEMGLDADIKFSRDLIRPENPDGSQGSGNVVTSFSTALSGWNDLVVQISLPPFQVNGVNGMGFSVQDAVFDFSDSRNAPGLVFPEGYNSTQTLPGNANLWRGFYMRELTVKLPPEFKAKGSTTRTTFSASCVIIDNMGFTGTLKATQLMSIDKGDMNGWAFSLDSIGVAIQANQLVEAGFNGKIVVPVSDERTPFEYKAIINMGGDYLFNVSPAKDISFNLWQAAHVDIYEASYLEIKVVDKKFLPKANLHGRMAVQAKLSEGGQGVELADITFENLEIQSVKPYIKVGNFSFGSEAAQQKMAGFPISINNIGLRSINDTQVGLDFDLLLNLVGEEGSAFSADAGLTLVGTMDTEKGWQSWRYKTTTVRDIAVDIDGGAFKIKGKLIFYRNDQSYGDGFNGTVKAEFTPGIKVTGTAIFGNVTGMRYWYADAMVNFPSGIPVFTGVGIYGFGGGAYYRMKMDNQGGGSELGKTASGVVYVPESKAGLGLKAIVSIGSHPKPEAFNGDVTFEISFFQGGGVRHIAFGGNGYLVTPGLDISIDKMKKASNKMVGVVKTMETSVAKKSMGLVKGDGNENTFNEIFGELGEKAGEKGQISARVMIDYDFENRVLHGNFEAYVNVAGGLIKGIGPGGRAGWCVLHFAPGEWYVYVGTPDDRIGISVGIGKLRASADSYFMVGTKILGSPPPPAAVTKILGGGDYNYMKDLNAIGTGGGFAFGASFSVSTGDLQFLMFYARFDAGAGFDIMLKDYGNLRCKGSSKRIGVNGWYANGQAYAYFEGKIGIRVKIFGKRRSVEILSIGAAALLQAQLPNPFWLQGTVGGYFRALGGLVKGNCKFQVTLGEKCEIVKDPNAILDDIKVIAELTPANGEKDVNVFGTPQALFNMPVDKNFELVDDANLTRTFRIRLDHFKVIADGIAQEGSLQWNENHDVLGFNTSEILPPKKDIKVSAQVSFEELTRGSWIKVVTDGKPITELVEQSFTTGTAPDYIPHENILYCYPAIGQLNFHKGNSTRGYIKLEKGQDYLFESNNDWNQVGRFTPASGNKIETTIGYTDNTVNFQIPTSLNPTTVYTYELINVPKRKSGPVDRNVSEVTNKVSIANEQVDTEIAGKKAEGSLVDLQEKSIFTGYFRTSKYETFESKMAAQTLSTTLRGLRVQWRVHYLKVPFTLDEPFDRSELYGTQFTHYKPLLKLEADLVGNRYYESFVHPLVYDGYPIGGDIVVQNRTTSVLGLPPIYAVQLKQTPDNLELNESTWQSNSFSATYSYNYDLPLYMNGDFQELQQKVASRYLANASIPARIVKMLVSEYPIVVKGTYKLNVKYYLPGNKDSSISKPVSFENLIGAE